MVREAAKRQEAKEEREKQWEWRAPKLDNQFQNNHKFQWSHHCKNAND